MSRCAENWRLSIALILSQGCSGLPPDPLNLFWNPTSELCHNELLECQLAGSRDAREQCARLYPSETQSLIHIPSDEEWDCFSQWQNACRARVSDEPWPVQLLDKPNGHVSLVVLVPKEGLPVEHMGRLGEWSKVRLESGSVGWVDTWTMCKLYTHGV